MFKKSSINFIYRIITKKVESGRSYTKESKYIVQRRVLFFFWVQELSDNYSEPHLAEYALREHIKLKHFQKYFAVTNASIIEGDTLSEVKKKENLKAFL